MSCYRRYISKLINITLYVSLGVQIVQPLPGKAVWEKFSQIGVPNYRIALCQWCELNVFADIQRASTVKMIEFQIIIPFLF